MSDDAYRPALLNRRRLLLGGAGAVAASTALAEPPQHHQQVREALEKAELSLLFRGSTAEQCRQWQRQFRAKLNELLGDSSPPRQWKAEQVARQELEDHVRLELVLRADNVPALPVYLLLPKRREGGPAAGMVCVHGHGDHGHHPIVGRRDLPGVAQAIDKAHYDYGLQLVRRGYVVAAPCLIPFGAREPRDKYSSDACAVALVRLLSLGRLPITENLRDLRWCIDLLQSRPEVAPERIGCGGLSYGGRMTMMCAAMDTRVKAAVVSGALNLMQERMRGRYSCGAQVIPGLLRYGDYSEIGALIAPRPCVWEEGQQDGLIVPKWDELFRQRLRKAYRALGAEDKLHFDRFAGGHRWNGEVAYPVLKQALEPNQ